VKNIRASLRHRLTWYPRAHPAAVNWPLPPVSHSCYLDAQVGCRGVVVLLVPSLDIATPVTVLGRLLEQVEDSKAAAAK
jgi:hypothetical protein